MVNNESPENEPAAADGTVRLNRYLAQCGYGSRRDCDDHIAHGRVAVDGVVINEFGVRIDPVTAQVSFDGKPVTGPLKHEYFAYHKPRGCVTTAYDPEGRETIYDALKSATGRDLSHLKYMGRLDRNSEGLLLLTNDGTLIHALTHPKYQIKKTYQVRIDRTLQLVDRQKMLTEGVTSEEQILHAGAIRDLVGSDADGENWYEVDLYEGKNRQIRRMFGELGYDVERLKRIQFANIKLNDLPRGQIRPLEEREIMGLRGKGYPAERPAGARSSGSHRSGGRPGQGRPSGGRPGQGGGPRRSGPGGSTGGYRPGSSGGYRSEGAQSGGYRSGGQSRSDSSGSYRSGGQSRPDSSSGYRSGDSGGNRYNSPQGGGYRSDSGGYRSSGSSRPDSSGGPRSGNSGNYRSDNGGYRSGGAARPDSAGGYRTGNSAGYRSDSPGYRSGNPRGHDDIRASGSGFKPRPDSGEHRPPKNSSGQS